MENGASRTRFEHKSWSHCRYWDNQHMWQYYPLKFRKSGDSEPPSQFTVVRWLPAFVNRHSTLKWVYPVYLCLPRRFTEMPMRIWLRLGNLSISAWCSQKAIGWPGSWLESLSDHVFLIFCGTSSARVYQSMLDIILQVIYIYISFTSSTYTYINIPTI